MAGTISGGIVVISNSATTYPLATVDNSGNIGNAGQMYSHGFNNISAADQKNNIRPYEGDPLDVVENTKVYRYTYKDQPDEEHIGFIADELHEDLANPDRNTYNLARANAILYEAVKMLLHRVQVLEDKAVAARNGKQKPAN